MAITKTSKNSLNTFSKFDNTAAGNYSQQFLATTGTSGTVLTSPDGITWTARTSGLPANGFAAPHRQGSQYVVFDTAYFFRWTSADGITWARNGRASNAIYGTTPNYIYASRYSAVDQTWNVYPNAPFTTGNAGSLFDVTNGISHMDTGVCLSNWGASGYATNGSVFIFAGGNSASSTTAPYLVKSTTTKGGTQAAQAYGASNYSNGCDYGNGLFAVIAGNNTGIYTSPDGTTWTSRGTTAGQGIIFLNGLWLAWGGSNLWTSTDAITWTARTVTGLAGNSIYSIAYGAGVYVLTAGGGYIGSSPDGTTWTSRTSGVVSTIQGVIYG